MTAAARVTPDCRSHKEQSPAPVPRPCRRDTCGGKQGRHRTEDPCPSRAPAERTRARQGPRRPAELFAELNKIIPDDPALTGNWKTRPTRDDCRRRSGKRVREQARVGLPPRSTRGASPPPAAPAAISHASPAIGRRREATPQEDHGTLLEAANSYYQQESTTRPLHTSGGC